MMDIDKMKYTIEKALELVPSMTIDDQMRLFIAYNDFFETLDRLVSKYDGRDERILELINKLNWDDGIKVEEGE